MLGTRGWREPHGLEGGEDGPDSDMMERAFANVGAIVMGRRMFGGEGPWGDEPWQGWWGDEPPFHVPVYVLTHHEREPLEKTGTTFHFVTGGIEAALAQAKAAAGDQDVSIAGGAETIQQAIRAGAVDELQLHVAPYFLGGGTPLFDGLPAGSLEPIEVVASPAVTHIRYRLQAA
jgi:dihydrofolate reductase